MIKSRKSKQIKRMRRIPRMEGRLLSDGPAYAGQQSFRVKMTGAPLQLTTTVSTGLIAGVYTIETSNISGFSVRFGSTFDEYRILSAKFMIRSMSVSTGVSVVWFDEKSNSSPTSNEASERIGQRICNTSSRPDPKPMTWRARDLLDLQYTPIGTVSTPAFLKLYTDNANWGSPTTATLLWILEPIITIEFRGLKSN